MPRTARRETAELPLWDLPNSQVKALCMIRRTGALLTPWQNSGLERTFGLDLQEHRSAGLLWLDARSEAGLAVEMFAATPARLEMELERIPLPPRAVFLSPRATHFMVRKPLRQTPCCAPKFWRAAESPHGSAHAAASPAGCATAWRRWATG